jgi:GNAT superfamily N-acetyltransferase
MNSTSYNSDSVYYIPAHCLTDKKGAIGPYNRGDEKTNAEIIVIRNNIGSDQFPNTEFIVKSRIVVPYLTSQFYVTDTIGKIIGYALVQFPITSLEEPSLQYDKTRFEIVEIAVAKENQNKGIGKALMKKILQVASENGVTSVSLEPAKANDVLQNFLSGCETRKWELTSEFEPKVKYTYNVHQQAVLPRNNNNNNNAPIVEAPDLFLSVEDRATVFDYFKVKKITTDVEYETDYFEIPVADGYTKVAYKLQCEKKLLASVQYKVADDKVLDVKDFSLTEEAKKFKYVSGNLLSYIVERAIRETGWNMRFHVESDTALLLYKAGFDVASDFTFVESGGTLPKDDFENSLNEMARDNRVESLSASGFSGTVIMRFPENKWDGLRKFEDKFNF